MALIKGGLLDRRGFLKTTVAAAAASTLPLGGAMAQAKRGGHLRVAKGHGNTTDTLNPGQWDNGYMLALGFAIHGRLTEVAPDGSLIPELAESWEASDDASEWRFKIRQGVTFHNGKAFGADDVIASLQMHVAEGAKSAAKPIIESIVEMKKITDHQVQFTLEAGNADFPYLLSDYHLLMYPAGQIEEAIAKGIGTGLYKVQSFEPGVRMVATRVDSHYKDGDAGFFDEIEYIAVNDNTARMNALLTGQVDAINRIDLKTEALLKANPMVRIQEVSCNQQYTFPMLTNVAPFDDVNVRRALKFAINRQEMVDKILLGHGRVGNDTPIGPANQYFAADMEQNSYDPDKAKFYLKEAGLSSLDIDLSASSAAFEGAVDAAQLYQASAKSAGININVVQEPADGYWSNVWLKKPFCACYWSGRATEDWMFSSAYEEGVPWNDTQWGREDSERFQDLLVDARAELDPTKRREMYTEMQQILRTDGGVVLPMFANYVQAVSNKIANPEKVGNLWQMDNARMAERWWTA